MGLDANVVIVQIDVPEINIVVLAGI